MLPVRLLPSQARVTAGLALQINLDPVHYNRQDCLNVDGENSELRL